MFLGSEVYYRACSSLVTLKHSCSRLLCQKVSIQFPFHITFERPAPRRKPDWMMRHASPAYNARTCRAPAPSGEGAVSCERDTPVTPLAPAPRQPHHTAVEQVWHKNDRQGQILVVALRETPFKLFPLRWEARRRSVTPLAPAAFPERFCTIIPPVYPSSVGV